MLWDRYFETVVDEGIVEYGKNLLPVVVGPFSCHVYPEGGYSYGNGQEVTTCLPITYSGSATIEPAIDVLALLSENKAKLSEGVQFDYLTDAPGSSETSYSHAGFGCINEGEQFTLTRTTTAHTVRNGVIDIIEVAPRGFSPHGGAITIVRVDNVIDGVRYNGTFNSSFSYYVVWPRSYIVSGTSESSNIFIVWFIMGGKLYNAELQPMYSYGIQVSESFNGENKEYSETIQVSSTYALINGCNAYNRATGQHEFISGWYPSNAVLANPEDL